MINPFDSRFTDQYRATVERRTQARIAQLRDDETRRIRSQIFGSDPETFEQIAARYPVLKEKVL